MSGFRIALLCGPCLLGFLWVDPGRSQELGTITFPTSTKSPEAHARFLRGLAWLHNFGYDEAIEHFRAAQQLDRSFAMAYWGEAMCHYRPVWHIENLEPGRAALAKLAPDRDARLARASTQHERAYLEAGELLFGDGDHASRHASFADAMRTIAERNPNDVDAAVFFAFGLLGTVPVGVYDDPRIDQAGRAAERAFKMAPHHPGAAHAVIHAYDDRERAPRALEAARTYAKIARGSSHARHMPAHIFVQLGMWDEAVASDEAAWQAAVAHVKARGLSSADSDFHPLSWLVYEYAQQGRFDQSREAIRPLEAAFAAAPRPGLKNELATWRAYYIVGSGRWAEVSDRMAFDNADELFAIGFAATKMGNRDKALATLNVMKKVAATDVEPTRRLLAAIMERQLAAAIHGAERQLDAALKQAAEAAAMEDGTPRSTGRPHPVKSSHELYGELLLDAKRPQDARKQFERSLWRAANRSSSVLGLARAAAATGDVATAKKGYEQFLKNWRLADPGRREIAEARAFVSR